MVGGEEDYRREISLLQDRPRIIEVITIAVVKSDERRVRRQGLLASQPGQYITDRNDIEPLADEIHLGRKGGRSGAHDRLERVKIRHVPIDDSMIGQDCQPARR